MVHSPKPGLPSNNPNSIKPKPHIGILPRSPTWVAGTQVLEQSFAAFQGAYQLESRSEIEHSLGPVLLHEKIVFQKVSLNLPLCPRATEHSMFTPSGESQYKSIKIAC